MSRIVSRSYMGGIDLYHGIPNLTDGKITNIEYSKNTDDYITELEIETVDGNKHSIVIMQERQ